MYFDVMFRSAGGQRQGKKILVFNQPAHSPSKGVLVQMLLPLPVSNTPDT